MTLTLLEALSVILTAWLAHRAVKSVCEQLTQE